MKRYIFLILVFIIAVTAVGTVSYRWGFNNAKEEELNNDAPIDDIGDSICKVDYPLIDIAFNDGNDYDVVIINGIYDENKEYLLCKNPSILQEHLWVNTYPAGRGTTGHSCIIVYKNGQEVKSVEYFEIGYGNEDLKNKFEQISKAEYVEFLEGK